MCRAMLVGVLLVLCHLVGADKAITAAGVTVKVKGQSGKMTLTVPSDSGTMDVECQMAALRQLDSSGTTLGGGGSSKHSFNSFATQSFTFSEPMNSTYESLQTAVVSFESTLVGTSTLKIDTMIFMESGNFKVGNDTISVTAGTVKFNVMLANWIWCEGSECKSSAGVGDAVELDISVAPVGKGSPKAKAGKGSYDVGGGSELLMLNTYSTDGGKSWLTMPSGYPTASGSTFTLRFPRWNGTVTYDPLVTGSSGDPETSGSITTRLSVVLVFLFAQMKAVM